MSKKSRKSQKISQIPKNSRKSFNLVHFFRRAAGKAYNFKNSTLGLRILILVPR